MEEFVSLCIENAKILYAHIFSEFYTVVILPNAKYIIAFCLIIGFFTIKDFFMNCLKKWIDKIP